MLNLSPTDSNGDLSPPGVQELATDLRPLMFWMSNATELLNFFQVKVEAMEKEWEFEGKLGLFSEVFLKKKKCLLSQNVLWVRPMNVLSMELLSF